MQHDFQFTRDNPSLVEAPEALTPLQEKAAELNARFKTAGARTVLQASLNSTDFGRTALVSSFGADSVVLLHMASIIDKSLPVIFVNTEMLFPETLDYQREVAARLND